jgi:hypothetical protein
LPPFGLYAPLAHRKPLFFIIPHQIEKGKSFFGFFYFFAGNLGGFSKKKKFFSKKAGFSRKSWKLCRFFDFYLDSERKIML